MLPASHRRHRHVQGLHRRAEAGDARLQRVGRREPPGHVHSQEGSAVTAIGAHASGAEPHPGPTVAAARVSHVMTSVKFACALPIAARSSLLRVPRPAPGIDERSTSSVRWNQALLQAVRDTRMAPPMVSRAIANVHTCGFDAWAVYDARRSPPDGAALRRPRRRANGRRTRRRSASPAHRAAGRPVPAEEHDFMHA